MILPRWKPRRKQSKVRASAGAAGKGQLSRMPRLRTFELADLTTATSPASISQRLIHLEQHISKCHILADSTDLHRENGQEASVQVRQNPDQRNPPNTHLVMKAAY